MAELHDMGDPGPNRGDPSSTPKILVVDDEATVLDFLSTFLAEYAYRVLCARDGETALRLAESEKPDLILLDLYLPGQNGFDVCRRIKAEPLTRHIPVICFTGAADDENRLLSLSAGANDFLSKPLHAKELLLRVRNILRLKETEDLRRALELSTQRQREVQALLASARKVLESRDFDQVAHAIFASCKRLLGATGGYVAVLNPDRATHSFVLFDTGGPCAVARRQTVPIRGIRAEAYRTGQPVCCNDFAATSWAANIPAGHIDIENVLVVPLLIGGEAEGLLALGNKPGGFVEGDAQLVLFFGELIAIALQNSRMLGALESSEGRLRSVLDSANDAVVALDGRGTIISWNRAAESIFGISRAAAEGSSIERLLPPQEHQAFRHLLEQALADDREYGLGRQVEVLGRRDCGREFPMELSLSGWRAGGEAFFTLVARDISARKAAAAEQERFAEHLRRMKQTEMVGKIAAGVSHEVRNPLHAIMSLTEALCLKVGGGAEYEPFVSHIRSQVNRLAVLMRELLDFGKPLDRERLQVLPFAEICRELETHWRDHPSGKVAPLRIEPFPGDETLPVLVDPLQMTQALLNLLENGADHAPAGEPLRLVVGQPHDGILAVEVIDAGCGIAAEVLERAFEPFFTTRRKGTGLGLSIVKRIIEDHGGSVTLRDNGAAPGTTATVLLPLCEEAKP